MRPHIAYLMDMTFYGNAFMNCMPQVPDRLGDRPFQGKRGNKRTIMVPIGLQLCIII